MNDLNYTIPSDVEIQAIYARAHRLRAEMLRAGVTSSWSWLRGLFVRPTAGAINAH